MTLTSYGKQAWPACTHQKILRCYGFCRTWLMSPRRRTLEHVGEWSYSPYFLLPVATKQLRIDIARLLRFDRTSIAAALNLLEDRRPARQEQALTLLDELTTHPALAHVVGITGPPGVG